MIGRTVRKLWRGSDGSALIEFALIGPVLIGLLMGVLQIGIGMQNYNALRSISADVTRHAVVNYRTNNLLTIQQLELDAHGFAMSPSYGLASDRFDVKIEVAADQRVTGATEYTMVLTYRVPTVLAVIGVGEIPLTFERPIFVIATP